MKISALLAFSVSVAAVAAYSATPPPPPPPIANYYMDVSTVSGLGAGMMGGGRPSLGQIMSMMNGGGEAVGHMLNLRLASREKPTAAPEANHFIPPGLQMGASLPLVTPPPPKEYSGPSTPSEPGTYEKPKGRILIYWGCGEHAGPNQPMVFDFGKMAEGQIPPGLSALARMGQSMGRMMAHEPRPGDSAGYGEWPNAKDSRAVPAAGSLIGAHRVEGDYSPPISFTLGAGQDFMPGLGLTEAGTLPSGADQLRWTPAAQATGYALALFGSAGGNDLVMWTSAKGPTMFPAFDFLEPSDVAKLVTSGAVLPPTTSQCILPAEVSKAVPQGMVMGIGYGPQAWFADKPKAPTWTTRVRFKTTAMLMRGMGGMMGGAESGDRPQAAADQQQPPPKKKHGFGLGDLVNQAIPH